ncbi:DNA ligase 1-like [Corythoichthys intestinalis]|uniref:DNA ligase 1-like n=1 Tax=Corythoichthys intestinalis TaxID=161448 RepID=UPI0025A656D6|nr:DNA ligase 1-like [Corythoichthys intestinalis]XP_057681346.1 DNA ligase 1-like [Corythoichthys intestinalis]XP_057681347.1 DNA ligase 1-like [Corythoichthys intestinalis]XP_057681348.1 DNA ligase 1-like [Corythoichthys intestinalis]XP_057681349.1 DNA ligase 1-like [Corythoichthys intestinalis]
MQPSDFADDEVRWTGRQIKELLREAYRVHRAELHRVRSFWMNEFGEFQRARDVAAAAALKAATDEWNRLWVQREEDIRQDIQTMRESVRLHVEKHWDNMEWHLDRTVDECDQELQRVKGVMERKVQEKEEQLNQLKELSASALTKLEEKQKQISQVKDILLLLKSQLEEKEEEKRRLHDLLRSVTCELQRERLESERWRSNALDLEERLEAGMVARMEVLEHQEQLLKRVNNVKSLVKGFVGHNIRFRKSVKSNDTSDDDQANKESECKSEKEEDGQRVKREKKERKEYEKRVKKEKKERDRKEKRERKDLQKKEKKEKF